MKKIFNIIGKAIFPTLIAITALAISGSAATFSVIGLSKLFAGAATAVIIMTGTLEVSKLVVASLLHQYWSSLNKLLKFYLTISVIVLIGITSMGIYGYLSAAYQETANKEGITQKELAIYDSKIENYKNQKSTREETANSVQQRITQLNEGINNIEYSWVDRDGAGDQRELLSTQLEIANQEYLRVSNNISKLDSTILALENERFETEISSDVAAELGPLKYISKISGWDMDKTVNILILIIVFVFDPLAICLVLAANFAFGKAFPKKRENIYGEKIVITQTPIVELEVDPNDLPNIEKNKPDPEKEKIKQEIKNIEAEEIKLNESTASGRAIHAARQELNTRKENLKKRLNNDDNSITY
jgi:hypothetical protein